MIYVKHQGRLQPMTERDLTYLTIKQNDVYEVHGGKIMDLGAMGQLRNNAIVHVVDKMPGGGKTNGPRKSSQSDQGAPDMSSSAADVVFDLMEKGYRSGRIGWDEGLIGKVLKLDDDAMQDMMRSLRTSIQVSMGTDPEHAFDNQAMKSQQEEATQETEHEDRRK